MRQISDQTRAVEPDSDWGLGSCVRRHGNRRALGADPEAQEQADFLGDALPKQRTSLSQRISAVANSSLTRRTGRFPMELDVLEPATSWVRCGREPLRL